MSVPTAPAINFPSFPRREDFASMREWSEAVDRHLDEITKRYATEPAFRRAWETWHGLPAPNTVRREQISPLDEARRAWDELYDRHYCALRADAPRSWEHPRPVSASALRAAVATVLHPANRQLLRDLLFDLLAPDIVRLSAALLKEVNRG